MRCELAKSSSGDLPVSCVRVKENAVSPIPSSHSKIAPFFVMDMLRTANEYQGYPGKVIHLEVGQPSSSAPRAVLEAATRALASERLSYTDCRGIPELRSLIAKHYMTAYGINISEREVFVTTGSSAGSSLHFSRPLIEVIVSHSQRRATRPTGISFPLLDSSPCFYQRRHRTDFNHTRICWPTADQSKD